MALDFLDKLTIITKRPNGATFLRQIYLNYKSNKFQSPEKWLERSDEKTVNKVYFAERAK